MIPKIIHFVWVGNQPKPQLVLDCIASWKKFCPDYKIMEWNNDSLKDINNKYVSEAFEHKKWAFVSDYLRLYALNKFGGFYFDTDLEITSNIDKFRNNKFVSGYETFGGAVWPFCPYFIGAEKGSIIISDLLSQYNALHFLNADGTYNQVTNTVRVSNYFMDKYGVSKPYDGTKITKLGKDGILYPFWFFCTPVQGKPNYAIHLFDGSWVDTWYRKDKFRVGRYCFCVFYKVKNRTDKFTLTEHERLIISIHRKNKYYVLTRRY